jgi:hypothetical protein
MPATTSTDGKSTAAMKVTTVRFGRDLWRLLEDEATLVGTSVSQYIREAALARAAAAAATRGQSPFELLAGAAELEHAVRVISEAQEAREGARALRAESRQARRTSRARKS